MATASTPVSKPPASWRRWLRLALLVTVVPYLGVVGLVYLFQRSLIYVPKRTAALPVSSARLPEANVEAVTVQTADGLTLHGWWFESRAVRKPGHDPARFPGGDHKPLVLYFCGNAGHRGYRLPEFDLLTSRGADILCCDYRGYGENEGSPSETGLAADAQAVWKYATTERSRSPDQIVLFGESLGGAVAIRLAAQLCDAGTPPAALITRSTFSSLSDVAREIIPWAPTDWLLLDRFASIERIGSVTCPILLLHGRRDTVVPYELGTKLFEAAPRASADGASKRLVDLPTADHNDVLDTEEQTFVEAITALLDLVRARREPPAGGAIAE